MIVDNSATVHRRIVRMSGLDTSQERSENDLSGAKGEITSTIVEIIEFCIQDQPVTDRVSIPPMVERRVPGSSWGEGLSDREPSPPTMRAADRAECEV